MERRYTFDTACSVYCVEYIIITHITRHKTELSSSNPRG